MKTDDLQPGVELDALVGERVFRRVWTLHSPRFSTDIGAAWEVVEKLGLSVIRGYGEWRVGHFDVDAWDGFIGPALASMSAPHAICLAALAALPAIAGASDAAVSLPPKADSL